VPIPFFKKIPTIGYDINGSGEKTLVVDILQRIKMRDILLNDYLIFYTYTVKDGETPEMIADKLYGSSQYHWIVLLANNIVDPFYDWPMSQENLVETIRLKYGTPTVDGLIYAYQTVDHYEDLLGNTVDSVTFHSLPAEERKEIRIYDQEVANNEAKRQIRLLDPNYITQVDNEADAIMKQALV
jgi:Base plate wedge protein 53